MDNDKYKKKLLWKNVKNVKNGQYYAKVIEELKKDVAKEGKNLGCREEYRIPFEHVRDMIITYSQMYRTGKYSQHSSIIWPVWLNG